MSGSEPVRPTRWGCLVSLWAVGGLATVVISFLAYMSAAFSNDSGTGLSLNQAAVVALVCAGICVGIIGLVSWEIVRQPGPHLGRRHPPEH